MNIVLRVSSDDNTVHLINTAQPGDEMRARIVNVEDTPFSKLIDIVLFAPDDEG